MKKSLQFHWTALKQIMFTFHLLKDHHTKLQVALIEVQLFFIDFGLNFHRIKRAHRHTMQTGNQ